MRELVSRLAGIPASTLAVSLGRLAASESLSVEAYSARREDALQRLILPTFLTVES